MSPSPSSCQQSKQKPSLGPCDVARPVSGSLPELCTAEARDAQSAAAVSCAPAKPASSMQKMASAGGSVSVRSAVVLLEAACPSQRIMCGCTWHHFTQRRVECGAQCPACPVLICPPRPLCILGVHACNDQHIASVWMQARSRAEEGARQLQMQAGTCVQQCASQCPLISLCSKVRLGGCSWRALQEICSGHHQHAPLSWCISGRVRRCRALHGP